MAALAISYIELNLPRAKFTLLNEATSSNWRQLANVLILEGKKAQIHRQKFSSSLQAVFLASIPILNSSCLHNLYHRFTCLLMFYSLQLKSFYWYSFLQMQTVTT